MAFVPSAAAARPDWQDLARRAKRAQSLRLAVLVGFLVLVSIPVILPYFWMVVIAFTARTGGVESDVLWRACAVLVPAVLLYALVHMALPALRARLVAGAVIGAATLALLAATIGGDLHLHNFRFLINPNVVEDLRGKATAGGQFPWVWGALANSLLISATQMVIVAVVATLAGYYLSRFAFRGRASFLQSLLVLQAFPAMTLVIPIFLINHQLGLLNTLLGPILVITTLELPFFIFIMKGFFDAVPWDIEMSALTDGASRWQAFTRVVLPQVRVGIIAICIFAFIKGWEEYVFVSALRTGSSYWVMSLYLYWVAQDVMGVDYGLVAAVAVVYVLPSLVLYLLCQKYLTQMTLGGVKG